MKNVAYYNGKFGEIENMSVPIEDRAVYFGDGIYDVATVKNGRTFAIDDHIDRFFSSCRLIRIDLPFDKQGLKKILLDVVGKLDSDITEAVLYFQASRGSAPRSHAFPVDTEANILVTLHESEFKKIGSPVALIPFEDKRYAYCNIKTINLLPNVLAAQYAKEHGCYEVVQHKNGRVTEGCHSNISILKNGVFRTAPLDNQILPGITRKHYIELCKKLNIPVAEEAFTLEELENADEIIVSSSTAICSVATMLAGKPVGGRDAETLSRLQMAYRDKILAEVEIAK